MNTSDRIKQRRLEIGLSADELATRIGKSRATIYRYENGDIENMPTSVLEPLAKALDTTPADLMGWEQSNEVEVPVNIIKKVPSKQEELISIYDQLSSRNQDKILTYSKSLLTKQQLDDEVYEVAAAHDRTDIEITAEGRQQDIDLMNDDSKWEE